MISIKEMAKGATMHTATMLVKDATYIPEEKLCFCPMGCAKTAEMILKEIARGNGMLQAAIKGGAPDAEFNAKVEAASGLDALGKLVMESAEKVCAVIDSIPESDLEKEAKMPWGATFPIYAAIFLPSQHMNYHDGQVNYIQTLLGDDAFHWLEA